MEGDKAVAVKLKSLGNQGNSTIAENDLEQSKEMKEVPMEEFRKQFRPQVSDTNEIQEELSSTNEKIETNEDRENETTNENSNQNLNDEAMTRMDAINEEKDGMSLTNADSNHEEPRSIDAIKEEIPVTSEANADSNHEEPRSIDAIKEEMPLTSEANADSNHEEPRSMGAIKEEMPLTSEANADSNNEELITGDVIKEKIPVTNEANADDLKQASMKKEDKSDPAYYLPDESYYDSFGYEHCQSCTCNCFTCFQCADLLKCSSSDRCDRCDCCDCCDWNDIVNWFKLPDSAIIRKARLIGLKILTEVILKNLYYIPVIREILVYVGLIITIVSLITSSIKLNDTIQSDQRQLEKTLVFIGFGFSMFGLVFTAIDSFIRFRHHGCRVFKRAYRKEKLAQKDDEDNAECCNDKCPRCEGTCGKSCVIVMDVTRIIVLETIFYPDLLIQVFQFIVLLVDNNYNSKMIAALTWFTTVKGLLTILIFVYAHKGFILIGIIFSIRKVKKEEKWNSGLFIIYFVLYMFGLMILQVSMIVIIGERFRYEYTNYRAIEMSGQLWYMIIFTFLMPLIGIFMFFVVHHFWTMTLPVNVTYDMIFKKMQTKGQKTKVLEKEIEDKNEFENDYEKLEDVSIGKKFIHPYISPLHIILIFGYSLLFLGFFICCTVDGTFGNWFWLYVATGVFAVLININATGVTIVWLVILAGVIAAIAAIVAAVVGTIAIIIAFCLAILAVFFLCTAICRSDK